MNRDKIIPHNKKNIPHHTRIYYNDCVTVINVRNFFIRLRSQNIRDSNTKRYVVRWEKSKLKN